MYFTPRVKCNYMTVVLLENHTELMNISANKTSKCFCLETLPKDKLHESKPTSCVCTQLGGGVEGGLCK